jgi:cytochrome P450
MQGTSPTKIIMPEEKYVNLLIIAEFTVRGNRHPENLRQGRLDFPWRGMITCIIASNTEGNQPAMVGEKLKMDTVVTAPSLELRTLVKHWLTGGTAARDLHDNPHELFDRLRAEEPVHRMEDGAYVLTRYADVKHFLSLPSTSREAALPPAGSRGYFLQMMSNFLAQKDPPTHTRLRRLVQKAFTPKALGALVSRIDQIIASRLRALAPVGRMELVRDFAEPIPVAVICTMLGLPDDFSALMAEMGTYIIANIDPTPKSAEFFEKADAAALRYADWLIEVIRDRECNPRPDLLTTLLEADGDDRLTHDEVVALVANLHFGGYETTASLIGVATVLLMRHPDQLAALRADPLLINSAMEEVLRYSSPGNVLKARVTMEPVTYSGVTIPAGSPVWALSQFANRDPEVFPDPHRFDIRRTPNDHMGFGAGVHFCIGFNLAKMEAKSAVKEIAATLPGIRLEGAEPVWRDSLITRGYETIPVAWNVG